MAEDNMPILTRFHPKHGANILLVEDGAVALRKASFANAVTICSRPLNPGEIFLVEIEKTEPGWTGHMRLGLTQLDPADPSIGDLPPYSLPDMTNMGNSWICAITKSHNRIQADPEGEPEEQAAAAVAAVSVAAAEMGVTAALRESRVTAANATSPTVNGGTGGGVREQGGGGVPDVRERTHENQRRQKRLNSDGTHTDGVRERGGRESNGDLHSSKLRGLSNGVGVGTGAGSQGLHSLLRGNHLVTSRGLVPCSALEPTPFEVDKTTGKIIKLKRDNILPTDQGSKIGIIYLPRGELAEMHYIINGEDQGAFTNKLPYRDMPLYPVVDVYGTTKQVRIIQLYGVTTLKSACRDTILKHIVQHGVNSLPLPRQLKDYLLFVI